MSNNHIHRRSISHRLLNSTAIYSLSLITFLFLGEGKDVEAQTIDGGETEIVGGTNETQSSPWNVGTNLIVGDTSSGTLLIQEGGQVINSNARIGDDAGAQGTVTVTGDGSFWNSQSIAFIGNSGRGDLIINSGGDAIANQFTIGNIATGEGEATVSGNGSTLTNRADMYVGNNGVGRLTIEDGSEVSSKKGYVGFTASGDGAVTITGAGSSWSNTFLSVGTFGFGEIDISDGGQMISSGQVQFSGSGSGTGVATISGAGSLLEANGTIFIGSAGVGNVTVSEGGVLRSTGTSSRLQLASQAGSVGLLNIGAEAVFSAAAAGIVEADRITMGSGTGKVVFNHTDADYDFNTETSGAGSVEVYSGTTNLLQRARHTGGTSIFGGVLSGNAITLGGDIAVSSGGTLVFDQGINSGTYSGVLSGTGTLAKYGSGQLTLDGANTFTGNMNVFEGTLTSSLSSLSGPVSLAETAMLKIIHDDGTPAVLSSHVTGLGGFEKSGSGTLTLGSNVNYNGTTHVSAGELIGDVDKFKDDVTIDGGATLELNSSGSQEFSHDIAGAGTLELNIGHSLNLTGSSSFTGTVRVQSGFLYGTTDAIKGDIHLASDTGLEFWQSTDGIYAGNLSGDGEVYFTLDTGNNVTFTGNSSFTGTNYISQGSLTGTTSSLSGGMELESSSMLVFDQNSDGEFSDSINGDTGALVKKGTGRARLTGSATYLGGTLVSAGVLAVDEDSLSGNYVVETNGSLEVVHSGTDDLILTNTISGQGGFVKSGSGWVHLAAGNTYTGSTRVQEGLLTGSTTSIKGNLEVDGGAEFEFAQVADGVYAGSISGGGGLIKSGEGILTLTGTNSYMGGTSIEGGIISIAQIAQLGTGPISLNGGTFKLTGANAQSVPSVNLGTNGGDLDVGGEGLTLTDGLTSQGGFTKKGIGKLLLDGTSNTVAGVTEVRQGSLIIGSDSSYNTAAFNGDIIVESDGVLGGHGTVTGNVTNYGRIAPGNSIGVETLNGNFVGNGIIEIEVEGNPDASLAQADLLIINGTVDLTGATLDLVLTPTQATGWSSAPTGPFVIIDNDGSEAITGTFATITDNLTFLDPTLNYLGGTGNDVELTLLRNDVSLSEVAVTANQVAVANAIETLGNGNAVYDGVIASLGDGAAAAAAYALTSGEINASSRAVLIDDSRYIRQRINDHLFAIGRTREDGLVDAEKTAAIGALSFWSEAYGSYAFFGGDGNAATADRNVGGVLFGADGEAYDLLRLGLVAGFSYSDFSISSRLSSGNSENFTVGGYARLPQVQSVPVFLQGGVVASWHQLSFNRDVTGLLTDELTSDQNATTLQVFGELGYEWERGRARVEPFAGVAYVHLFSNGYREQGGDAALSANSQNEGITFTTLGLRSDWDFTLGAFDATLSGLAAWQYASEDTIDFTQAFVSGGNPFTISSVPISQNVALLEAGLDAYLTDNTRFGAAYYGLLSSDIQDHGFNLRLLWQY